jgi:hypothetical protein
MLHRWAFAILGAVALASYVPPADAARSTQTLVIGDSLTYRATDQLAALHPDWMIDGVPGRGLTALIPVLKKHLAADGAPETLVIALGTNSLPGNNGDVYADAVALVPASTRVVFVTLYRDPVIYGAETADRMRALSHVMSEVAADRPGSVVAWWRSLVVQHPELLVDGVHQTDPDGYAAWVAQVDSAWTRVHPAVSGTR